MRRDPDGAGALDKAISSQAGVMVIKRIIGTAVGALAGFLIGYLSHCAGATG